MPYVVPPMPLAVNIWTYAGVIPPVGAPRVVTVGNLANGKRVQTQWWDWYASLLPSTWIHLLLPKGTDIRGFNSAIGADVVECPAGTGRFYHVNQVDDYGKGFPNEHRYALLQQLAPWPDPIP